MVKLHRRYRLSLHRDGGRERWGAKRLLAAEHPPLSLYEWEPVCPVRGLATGEPTTVWRNMAYPAFLNRHRDLSWMVAHEILPVRAIMHSRRMARTSACPRPRCGQDEFDEALALGVQSRQGPVEGSRPPDLPVSASRGGPNAPVRAVWGGPKAFTKLWPTLTCEGCTVVLPQPAGSKTSRDHPPGSGHGSPGVVQKKGGLDSRRSVPHNTQCPGGHDLTALRRLGEVSPLGPDGLDVN
ncbi:uncharacterized protein ACWYII_030766 [Salvelinus alpinus]